MTLAVVTFAASPAVAELGPKVSDYFVTVNSEGEPIKDQDAVAALLSLKPERQTPINMATPMPQLNTPQLADASGNVWTYAGYLWGGQNENGRFRFHGFQPVGVMPDQVKLAVHLPSQDRTFVTEISPTRPYLARMTTEFVTQFLLHFVVHGCECRVTDKQNT